MALRGISHTYNRGWVVYLYCFAFVAEWSKKKAQQISGALWTSEEEG